MCVCVLVCVCVNFFCVKDFSGTTEPRVLKFGINVGYNLFYRVRESTSSCLSFFLFVHFSFSPIKISVSDFTASMKAKVFKFCIHFEHGLVYCGKENQDAEINFCLLIFIFPFFHLSLHCYT